jgi:uncharacterized protein (TIGR02452 family)
MMTEAFIQREHNAAQAAQHHNLMLQTYSPDDINKIILGSSIQYIMSPGSCDYDRSITVDDDRLFIVDWSTCPEIKRKDFDVPNWLSMNHLWITDLDTVGMIRYLSDHYSEDKICALNYASYTNPGGMYMKGSMAQEEFLCHHSNLYEVLSNPATMQAYYDWNRKNRNRCLYSNNILYTPNISFSSNRVSVITAAAPNIRTVDRYKYDVTNDERDEALIHRILAVLETAKINGVNALIAGAFGCGVFKNNPRYVLIAFDMFHTAYYAQVMDLWLAIPRSNYNHNYSVFYDTFLKCCEYCNSHSVDDLYSAKAEFYSSIEPRFTTRLLSVIDDLRR